MRDPVAEALAVVEAYEATRIPASAGKRPGLADYSLIWFGRKCELVYFCSADGWDQEVLYHGANWEAALFVATGHAYRLGAEAIKWREIVAGSLLGEVVHKQA